MSCECMKKTYLWTGFSIFQHIPILCYCTSVGFPGICTLLELFVFWHLFAFPPYIWTQICVISTTYISSIWLVALILMHFKGLMMISFFCVLARCLSNITTHLRRSNTKQRKRCCAQDALPAHNVGTWHPGSETQQSMLSFAQKWPVEISHRGICFTFIPF